MAYNEGEYKKSLQAKNEEQYKQLLQSLGPRFQQILREETNNMIQQKVPQDLELSGGSYNPKSGLGLQFDVPETYADPSLFEGMEPTRGTFKVPGGSVTYEPPETGEQQAYEEKLGKQEAPPGYESMTLQRDKYGNMVPTYTYKGSGAKFSANVKLAKEFLKTNKHLSWKQQSKIVGERYGVVPEAAGRGIRNWIDRYIKRFNNLQFELNVSRSRLENIKNKEKKKIFKDEIDRKKALLNVKLDRMIMDSGYSEGQIQARMRRDGINPERYGFEVSSSAKKSRRGIRESTPRNKKREVKAGGRYTKPLTKSQIGPATKSYPSSFAAGAARAGERAKKRVEKEGPSRVRTMPKKAKEKLGKKIAEARVPRGWKGARQVFGKKLFGRG